jgi:hypothetical protein
MLKAHLQAWVWQDEWFGLTMEVRKHFILLIFILLAFRHMKKHKTGRNHLTGDL